MRAHVLRGIHQRARKPSVPTRSSVISTHRVEGPGGRSSRPARLPPAPSPRARTAPSGSRPPAHRSAGEARQQVLVGQQHAARVVRPRLPGEAPRRTALGLLRDGDRHAPTRRRAGDADVERLVDEPRLGVTETASSRDPCNPTRPRRGRRGAQAARARLEHYERRSVRDDDGNRPRRAVSPSIPRRHGEAIGAVSYEAGVPEAASAGPAKSRSTVRPAQDVGACSTHRFAPRFWRVPGAKWPPNATLGSMTVTSSPLPRTRSPRNTSRSMSAARPTPPVAARSGPGRGDVERRGGRASR